MTRPFQLEPSIYEEIAYDEQATEAATWIVLATSLVVALGHLGLGMAVAATQFFVVATLSALGAGIAYALLALGSAEPGRETRTRVWRVLGFASLPRAIAVVLVVPVVGPPLALIALAIAAIASAQALRVVFGIDWAVAAAIAAVSAAPLAAAVAGAVVLFA